MRRAARMAGALVVLAGCGDLVGVNFGAVHLATDAGGPPTDAGIHRDVISRDVEKHHDAPSDAYRDGSGCNPAGTPSTEPCIIAKAYGVFVAPPANGGSDGGDGTETHPYATISKGIASAGGQRVFVCSATYDEQLTVGSPTDGTRVYGGLVCPPLVVDGEADGGAEAGHDAGRDAGLHTDGGALLDGAPLADGGDAAVDAAVGAPWTYSGVPAVVAPSARGYALTVEGLTVGASFADLSFIAQPADVAVHGSSSIAVLVNDSNHVSFVRVSATAGSGTPGLPSNTPPSNAATVSLEGAFASTGIAGLSTTITCPIFGTSTGGSGVTYGEAVVAANNGSSTPAVSGVMAPDDGKAAPGGPGLCTPGDPGGSGAPAPGGTPGPQGTLTGLGWVLGANGGAPQPSNPGQGGGGGGWDSLSGYAAGGGGSGSCGGNGGGGGTGGGASIAVALVNSTTTFASVMLYSAQGGIGGPGGQGEAAQAGGPGGLNHNGNGVRCQGGQGGAGAGGSGGGGGAGGPSVGIGWVGSKAPTVDGVSTSAALTLPGPSAFIGGVAGPGGPGGEPGVGAPGGVSGMPGSIGTIGAIGAVASF